MDTFKVGDKVLVDHKSDWSGWVSGMDSTVGEVLEVTNISPAQDEEPDCCQLSNRWFYPTDCLSLVVNEEPQPALPPIPEGYRLRRGDEVPVKGVDLRAYSQSPTMFGWTAPSFNDQWVGKTIAEIRQKGVDEGWEWRHIHFCCPITEEVEEAGLGPAVLSYNYKVGDRFRVLRDNQSKYHSHRAGQVGTVDALHDDPKWVRINFEDGCVAGFRASDVEKLAEVEAEQAPEFKPGDKVKIVKMGGGCSAGLMERYVGQEGIVKDVKASYSYPIEVTLQDRSRANLCFAANELELLPDTEVQPEPVTEAIPGEGYRLLQPGEAIREGDEVLHGDDGEWVLTDDAGRRLNTVDLTYRRLITELADWQPTGNEIHLAEYQCGEEVCWRSVEV